MSGGQGARWAGRAHVRRAGRTSATPGGPGAQTGCLSGGLGGWGAHHAGRARVGRAGRAHGASGKPGARRAGCADRVRVGGINGRFR